MTSRKRPVPAAAFVVHQEVVYPSILGKVYNFTVLPTDVDNGLGFGIEILHTIGMAGDFGKGPLCIPDIPSAVSGTDDGGVLYGKAILFTDIPHQLFRCFCRPAARSPLCDNLKYLFRRSTGEH